MDIPSTSQTHPSTSQAHPSTSQAYLTSSNESDVDDLQVKCRYMTLLEEVENIEGNCDVSQNIVKLNGVIDKANQLFPQVKKPSQLYWDAKVLHCTTVTLEGTCNNVDVGEGNFKLFTFAEQLKSKSYDRGRSSWRVFAAAADPVVHNSLPYWSPLLGSFEFQADVPQTPKQKKPRPQKEQAAEKKEPEKLKSIDKTHEGIAETVQKIYSKLKTCYKRNGKKPINYFKFVINPHSFASTVENIFHVSFLLNDGLVIMELDNDEPFIHPISKGKENSNPETVSQTNERLQNIFTIDMNTWKGIIVALDINSAMI